MTRTLLVIGASGQLGQCVARGAVGQGWRVVGTFHRAPLETLPIDWRELDLTDVRMVEALIADIPPDAVVNAALQMTQPWIWPVNAGGAAAVALATARIGARLIHISSDAIFDGEQSPYTEADDPSPITVYGGSKAAAETAVRAIMPAAAVIRTSLLIADDPLDKHSRMALDIAQGLRPEKLFTDEFRCPIAAIDLAAAILELIDLPVTGILNVVGADAVSRYELGQLVTRRHGLDPNALLPATLAASGLHRPADIRLDISRATALLKTRLRGVREFLGDNGTF